MLFPNCIPLREVCHKHRKIRREMLPAGVTLSKGWQRCLFFFVVGGAGAQVEARAAFIFPVRSSFKSRMPERHSGDAGATPSALAHFPGAERLSA
jgi:hypothetical protein